MDNLAIISTVNCRRPLPASPGRSIRSRGSQSEHQNNLFKSPISSFLFVPIREIRVSLRGRCARRENFKTKIALFLHHFCIIFRNHGSYKMQWRSRPVTSGHLWSRVPIGSCRSQKIRLEPIRNSQSEIRN
jgi:hypothetical protein